MPKFSGDRNSRGRFFYQRLLILISVLTLMMIGLISISSATQSLDAGSYRFLERQMIWLGLAIGVGVFSSLIDLDKIKPLIPIAALLAVAVLILVLIPGIGKMVNGSRRWILLGGIGFQPSEFAKIPFIFLLAYYLNAQQRNLKDLKLGLLIPLIFIGVFAGLILLEPDFGTCALFGAVGMLMLFLSGARLIHLIPTAVGGGVVFLGLILQDEVRSRRLFAFLDVEGNRQGGSYQLYQGWLAFVNGGATGVGAGNGRYQNDYLPEAHTDFILAIIGEEFGFMITTLVVVLFATVFCLVIFSLKRAPNMYQAQLVMGTLLMISMQALINMGVVTGLLPTKGLSLPFISYGGSNLIVMCSLTGILINCLRTWERLPLCSDQRKLVEITA